MLSREIAETEVPDTIQGIIASRIDRLEPSLKRVMQAASVIGREFGYRILQSITGMREELKTSLLQLQDLAVEGFRCLTQQSGERYEPVDHALIKAIAYQENLKKNRKAASMASLDGRQKREQHA